MAGRSVRSSSRRMLNLHVVPPRTPLRLRTPLLSTSFRQQSRLRLRTHVLGRGRVEREYTSTSSSAGPITASAPSQPPPESWVERAPKKIRPYFYLARVDKPIGTLLLYYPCSTSVPFIRNRNHGIVTKRVGGSLVDNDGFVCAQPSDNHTIDVFDPLRSWCVCNARSGVYDQRYVGPEFGQGCR